jgi:hypothetical protein
MPRHPMPVATISTVCCVETRILVPGMHANAGQVTGCSSNLKRPPACRLSVVKRDGGPEFLIESSCSHDARCSRRGGSDGGYICDGVHPAVIPAKAWLRL